MRVGHELRNSDLVATWKRSLEQVAMWMVVGGLGPRVRLLGLPVDSIGQLEEDFLVNDWHMSAGRQMNY